MKGLADLIESMLLPKQPTSSGHESQSESGFHLGVKTQGGTQARNVYLQESDFRKHVYALGATGCGKSNLLVRLVGHDIEKGKNAVVIDLRGDLIDRLIGRMSQATLDSGRIHLIDLREPGHRSPFNPLIGRGSAYSRALMMLEVIRLGSPSWGVQLEETLRYALVALAEANGSLLDIEILLSDPIARESILRRCTDEQVRRFFVRFNQLSSERQMSWTLPVLNKLAPFWSVPQVRAMLSNNSSFDWHDWIDSPGHVVLISLAAHRFPGVAQTLGGLLVASLQHAVMSRADVPESQRIAVTLFVDEFETMATPSFNSIIAEGRRFGLAMFLAHQNLSQLDSSLRQAIRANVQTSLVFQCSAHDAGDFAADIITPFARERLRQRIATQPVGAAYLVRRAQETVQVTTVHSPDPVVAPKVLADRRAQLLVGTSVVAAEKTGIPSSMEVRHERRPMLD